MSANVAKPTIADRSDFFIFVYYLGLKRNWELRESKKTKIDPADLDDWAFDTQDRHLPFAPGKERDQTCRRCADVSRFEALSAVWPRTAGKVVRRSGDPLRTFS